MRKLTIQKVKQKLKADESTQYVNVFPNKEATTDMCWILPDGYIIDCSCFDHSDIAETIGFGIKAALNRGWVRKGSRGSYHFIRTAQTIKMVEDDIAKDIAMGHTSRASNFMIDLGSLKRNRRGVQYSYSFDREDYERNHFNLEMMLRKKYQVHPPVKREDLQTYR